MLKKLLLFSLLIFFWMIRADAANLLDVYQDALCNDPTYRERLNQAAADKQGLPIAIAGVLPNINVSYNPSITRSGFTGSLYAPFDAGDSSLAPRNTTTAYAELALTVRQTIFDFSKFQAIASANADAKRAIATTYAALQELIVRVSKAYFDVLRDEDIVSYTRASMNAYQRQVTQARERHRVGLSNVTEVYTAETSYNLAYSAYLAAKLTLVNDKEILRAITSRDYSHLDRLSERFPLVSPLPHDVHAWTRLACRENWSIRALRYKVKSLKEIIHQQIAGHLPTLEFLGQADRIYVNNINGYNSLNNRNGPGSQSDRQVGLILNVPVFSGGQVVAQTNQAIYNMRVAYDQLQATTNDAIRRIEQNYHGIIITKEKIKKNKAAIRKGKLSLEGVEVSYKVGTATLIDVLTEQQKVIDAQTRFARDRYDFVNYFIQLKEAAGTLSAKDLIAINHWLIHKC